MTNDDGLSPPTAREVINALADVVGEENARRIWAHACDEFYGSAKPNERLDDLYRVVRLLSRWPGAVGVAARGMLLRIEAYLASRDEA